MQRFRIVLGLILVGVIIPNAQALPLATGAPALVTPHSALEIEATEVDFTAIVALNNCSGSLVRFTTSHDTDKAMVMTNGHCLEGGGFLRAGQVVTGRASTRSFQLLASDGRSNLGTLRAQSIAYATMTDTDVAIYKLTDTFAAIKARHNVDALIVSDHKPAAGAPMRVVSGYWKRIYACDIDDFVYQLREDQWTFTDSIRYSSPGCNTVGGTSGSPILHADTREVIGVNNTGNEDGGRCTMNNPCEVDAMGTVVVRSGASYGQQTYKLYSCLNAANDIDLTIDGCELPKPAALVH